MSNYEFLKIYDFGEYHFIDSNTLEDNSNENCLKK